MNKENFTIPELSETVDFKDIPIQSYLIGLLSAFDNRFQASADRYLGDITWKQFFAVICINLCRENPTINELAAVMGCSHQNVKQILLKLQKKGFVEMRPDSEDRRKQRISLTDGCRAYCERNDEQSREVVSAIFAGIDEKELLTAVKVITEMERNIENL